MWITQSQDTQRDEREYQWEETPVSLGIAACAGWQLFRANAPRPVGVKNGHAMVLTCTSEISFPSPESNMHASLLPIPGRAAICEALTHHPLYRVQKHRPYPGVGTQRASIVPRCLM
jgi:hypothetical protein